MAASSFEPSLAEVLASEGGWSEHPSDPGGATMKGITLGTFKQWRGTRHLTKLDLQQISDVEVRAIYRVRYWNEVEGDLLPHGIDHFVMDMGVNAGTRRSAIFLQRAAGMDIAQQDGAIGPRTLAAVKRVAPEVVMSLLAKMHEQHYRGLHTFKTFGKGWLARLERRIALANELLREA